MSTIQKFEILREKESMWLQLLDYKNVWEILRKLSNTYHPLEAQCALHDTPTIAEIAHFPAYCCSLIEPNWKQPCFEKVFFFHNQSLFYTKFFC